MLKIGDTIQFSEQGIDMGLYKVIDIREELIGPDHEDYDPADPEQTQLIVAFEKVENASGQQGANNAPESGRDNER